MKNISVVKQIISKDVKNINEKYKNPVTVLYKIELTDVKIKTLLKNYHSILEELKKEQYYLLELHITQDCAGIFNKEEMIKYLTNNFNFRMEGELKGNCNVIVNNNKNTVGIDYFDTPQVWVILDFMFLQLC